MGDIWIQLVRLGISKTKQITPDKKQKILRKVAMEPSFLYEKELEMFLLKPRSIIHYGLGIQIYCAITFWFHCNCQAGLWWAGSAYQIVSCGKADLKILSFVTSFDPVKIAVEIITLS